MQDSFSCPTIVAVGFVGSMAPTRAGSHRSDPHPWRARQFRARNRWRSWRRKVEPDSARSRRVDSPSDGSAARKLRLRSGLPNAPSDRRVPATTSLYCTPRVQPGEGDDFLTAPRRRGSLGSGRNLASRAKRVGCVVRLAANPKIQFAPGPTRAPFSQDGSSRRSARHRGAWQAGGSSFRLR